jgi:Domain of unknown function (DUF397)
MTERKPDLTGIDLTALPWRTSSHTPDQHTCVEVARLPDGWAVRDSKDRTGPILTFTHAEWDAFLAGARDGEFDI